MRHVLALVLLCARWGVVAIAWAVLASSLLATLLSAWAIHLGVGYSVGQQFRDNVDTVLLSLPVAAACWLLLGLMGNGIPALCLVTVGSAALYVTGAWIVRHPTLSTAWDMVRALYPHSASSRQDTGGRQ